MVDVETEKERLLKLRKDMVELYSSFSSKSLKENTMDAIIELDKELEKYYV